MTIFSLICKLIKMENFMFEEYLDFLSKKLNSLNKFEVRIAYVNYYSKKNKIEDYDNFIEQKLTFVIFTTIDIKENQSENFLKEYNQKEEENIYLKYI